MKFLASVLGLALAWSLATCPALAETITGRCTSVTDGDTVQLTTASKQTYKIRLHGIDAPEKKQAFGSRAKQALSDLCFGKQIRAEVQDKDRYGRYVADLYDGEFWLNASMVKSGLAWHYRQYSKSAQLAQLEAEARQLKLGLWADAHPEAPWDFRHGAKKTKPSGAPSSSSKSCKTCSQYASCAEIRAALAAGCTRLDGNGDGQACESRCP